ncbi:MAG TPA: hypothetical protein VHL57_02995 [Flavobacteriales bacterium]|jgi:hypothetical protein|nr:hypothetical protein [Flavobacteriales bacterium]
MSPTTLPPNLDVRRAAARRTALWLGAVAAAIFVSFIVMAVRK